MKVSDLMESEYVREFNTLNAVLDVSMRDTNEKYATPNSNPTKLDNNNFCGESMYYGAKDAVFYVMWMLTNNMSLDISSLYNGDDEISKALKARISSRAPPTEEEMMIDCLGNEIVPMFQKYGATRYSISSDTSSDNDKEFMPIGLFDARKIYEESKDDEGHVFKYLHFYFPDGVALHHDPVIAKKIENARVYPKRKRTN